MRVFIGALALTVICVLAGAPAVFVLGRSALTAADRQSLSAVKKDRGKLSHIERHLGKPAPKPAPVKTAVN
jgi:hypothetical protein